MKNAACTVVNARGVRPLVLDTKCLGQRGHSNAIRAASVGKGATTGGLVLVENAEGDTEEERGGEKRAKIGS